MIGDFDKDTFEAVELDSSSASSMTMHDDDVADKILSLHICKSIDHKQPQYCIEHEVYALNHCHQIGKPEYKTAFYIVCYLLTIVFFIYIIGSIKI